MFGCGKPLSDGLVVEMGFFFGWCPRGKFLVCRRIIGAWFDFKGEAFGDRDQSVPAAGEKIHDGNLFAVHEGSLNDISLIVKKNNPYPSREKNEGLCFGWVEVPMGTDIGEGHHGIEKPLDSIRELVEVIVFSFSRRVGRFLEKRSGFFFSKGLEKNLFHLHRV